MPLQLIGLNRCTSCTTDELVWRCPACDGTVQGEAFGDDQEGLSLQGVRCASCGADREVTSYMVPEALTDFWVHDIRSAERIRRVEYSDELGRPTALHLRQRVIAVEQILFFVRVSDDSQVLGPVPYGAYFLRTELGACVVVCAPHELGEGEIFPMVADWYLVETDRAMQQELRGRKSVSVAFTDDEQTAVADEGLSRNAFAYRIMYRVENALRDLLAQRLRQKAQGQARWWDAVVPETLRDYAKNVQVRRNESAWFELPQGEPIAFATLAQLRELLDDDWQRLGTGLGPKEVILGALKRIEFYRNELAHCRPLSLRMLSELHDVQRSLDRLVSGQLVRS